jgi:hypothetical protein
LKNKFNIEKEGLKAADDRDDHVGEIDISKSCFQLLLVNCTGDYPYDLLELINFEQTAL